MPTAYERLHRELDIEMPEAYERPNRDAYFGRLMGKLLTENQRRAMRLWLGWHAGHPEAEGNYTQTGKAMGIKPNATKLKINASIYKMAMHLRKEEELTRREERANAIKRERSGMQG